MPKLFFVNVFLLFSSIVYGQYTIGNQSGQGNRTGLRGDLKGNPIQYNSYEYVTVGTAFLFEDYRIGMLTSGDGIGYPPLMLKVDLVVDKVYYLDGAGKPLELVTPVMYVKFEDSTSKMVVELLRAKYFENAAKVGINGWLQILESGKAMLLKPMEKTIQKTVPYGTGVAEVSIVQKGGYVIAVGKEALLVKKYKDAVEMLEMNNPAIKNFKPTQKGLEAQLAELVSAFNQL